ncbi:MAG: hypothetical protein PVJ73_01575, partial [Acidobacteriota bacterium]
MPRHDYGDGPESDHLEGRGAWRAAAVLALTGLTMLGLAVPSEGGFAFRKPLAINGSQVVGGPHLDFPVLVSIVDPDLRSVANGGGVESDQGYDIAFRAADGTTPLDWEIEWYDPTNGALVAWVRFPGTVGPPDTRIQNGVDTPFYAYYGDPTIGCCQTSHGDVWDANFRYVLHLDQFTGNPVDSTRNGVGTQVDPNGDGVEIYRGNMGSPINLVAWDLATDVHLPTPPPPTYGPTTDTYLRVVDGTIPADQPYTFEAWFRMDNVNPNYVGIVTKGRDGGFADWAGLWVSDIANGNVMTNGNNTNGDVFGSTTLVTNRWYYGAVTWTTGRRRVYLYDLGEANDTAGPFTHGAITLPSRVGDDSNGSYLDGRIDEIRVSNVERSSQWLQTTARNQACSA